MAGSDCDDESHDRVDGVRLCKCTGKTESELLGKCAAICVTIFCIFVSRNFLSIHEKKQLKKLFSCAFLIKEVINTQSSLPHPLTANVMNQSPKLMST